MAQYGDYQLEIYRAGLRGVVLDVGAAGAKRAPC
jgi:hypothetical protein